MEKKKTGTIIAKQMIMEYIEYPTGMHPTRAELCNTYGIKLSSFEKIIQAVKEADEKLYKEYRKVAKYRKGIYYRRKMETMGLGLPEKESNRTVEINILTEAQKKSKLLQMDVIVNGEKVSMENKKKAIKFLAVNKKPFEAIDFIEALNTVANG